MSLDLRVEALFLLLMNLTQYVVDSIAAPGRAALRRSGALWERFRVDVPCTKRAVSGIEAIPADVREVLQ